MAVFNMAKKMKGSVREWIAELQEVNTVIQFTVNIHLYSYIQHSLHNQHNKLPKHLFKFNIDVNFKILDHKLLITISDDDTAQVPVYESR